MKDYIKQVQDKKFDCIILFVGSTNDVGEDEIGTIANTREIIKQAARECPDTELAISLTTRSNHRNGLARDVL